MVTNCRRAVELLLKTAAFLTLFTTLTTTSHFTAAEASRELRPSDHGLSHQSPSASVVVNASAMATFFGSEDFSSATPLLTAEATTHHPPAPASSWSEGERRNDRKMEEGLRVAAIVCGGCGFVLFLAGGLVLAFHFHVKRGRSVSAVKEKSLP